MTTVLKAAQLETGELNAKQVRPMDRRRRSRWPWVAAPLMVLVACALFCVDRASDVKRPPVIRDSLAATRQTAPASTPLTQSTAAELPWGRVEEPKYAPHAARKIVARAASKAPTPAAVKHAAVHGSAGVQLRSIDYSQETARRSVTLQIAGGSAVTLHEGESARGIEVQLILPRMVYLRQGASVFALGSGG